MQPGSLLTYPYLGTFWGPLFFFFFFFQDDSSPEYGLYYFAGVFADLVYPRVVTDLWYLGMAHRWAREPGGGGVEGFPHDDQCSPSNPTLISQIASPKRQKSPYLTFPRKSHRGLSPETLHSRKEDWREKEIRYLGRISMQDNVGLRHAEVAGWRGSESFWKEKVLIYYCHYPLLRRVPPHMTYKLTFMNRPSSGLGWAADDLPDATTDNDV